MTLGILKVQFLDDEGILDLWIAEVGSRELDGILELRT